MLKSLEFVQIITYDNNNDSITEGSQLTK